MAFTSICDHGDRAEECPECLGPILNLVETTLNRFVVFVNVHQAVAITLWVAHTHAIEAVDTTPYVHVSSAEKRSGKTRLLEVLEQLVPEPVRGASMSPAVLFRAAG
jgi:hypothetical protein